MIASINAGHTDFTLDSLIEITAIVFNNTQAKRAREIAPEELTGNNPVFQEAQPYAAFRAAALLYAHADMKLPEVQIFKTFWDVSPPEILKTIGRTRRAVEQGGMKSMEIYANAYQLICKEMDTTPAVTRKISNIQDNGISLATGARIQPKTNFYSSTTGVAKPAEKIGHVDADKIINAVLREFNKLYQPKTPTDKEDLKSQSSDPMISLPREIAITALYNLAPPELKRTPSAFVTQNLGVTDTFAIDNATLSVLRNILSGHEPTLNMLAAVTVTAKLDSVQASDFLRGKQVKWDTLPKGDTITFSL